jgi:O-antigen/teichoic acid export membrane protein
MASTDSLLPPLSSEEIAGGAAPVQMAESRHRNLESKAISGTLWTIFAYGLSQSLRMVNSVVITHILMPELFGLMSLVTTLILGMALLSDIGLLPGVIGSPRGDEPLFLDTVWTIQIVRGFALFAAGLLLTYPVGLFYHDRHMFTLLPVLSFTFIIDGFCSTNLMTAARHIGVRRLLTINMGAQAFAVAVTISWAFLWPSIWALVAGSMSASLFKMVVSHIPPLLPGRRNTIAWDKETVHSMVHFGKWIMIGTAFFFLASQADRLILGRLISFTMLGVYGIAFTFADIPRQIIQQFSYRVGLPFISKLTHLPFDEFRRNCLKYRSYALIGGAFILSVVVNAGGPIVLKLYDHRYAAAGWMVPILALGLWHTLLYWTSNDILVALGKSKYNAIGTAFFCATMFISLPIAFHFGGMLGAVITVAAGDIPLYCVITYGVQREKVSVWRQDALMTGVFLAFLAAGYFLKHLIIWHTI